MTTISYATIVTTIPYATTVTWVSNVEFKHFYVNLILLVVGEYLKSLLLQPTRELFVLFYISWLLLHPLKTIEKCKMLG